MTTQPTIDENKLNEFTGRFVEDLDAVAHATPVLIRLREVITAGGFSRFRRASDTPFNLVFEARPSTASFPRRAVEC